MLDPYPSLDQLWKERDRERRAESAARYIAKFKPMFDAIQREIACLEQIALYDSAAREAANILIDALHDARSTINGSAE